MNEDKLHVITTLDRLEQVIQYFKDNINLVNQLVAFDTETTGPNPIIDRVIGFSFSLYQDEGFYIVLETMTDSQGLCTEAPQSIPKEGFNLEGKLYECVSPAFKARALELLELLKAYKLLMHNAAYDVIITRRNFGIDYIKSIYCDTILLKHTLDCDKPHGLKECAVKYFGEESKDEQTELGGSVIRNGGKWTSTDKWVWHGDLYYVGKYACMDTMLTLRLFNHLDPQLDELKLREFFYDDEVMPLLRYGTIPMKDTGFKIDVGHFKRAKIRIQSEIDEIDRQLRAEIEDVTGPIEQLNLDSKYPPKPGGAFGQALVLESGLPLPINPKTGKFSTAKAVITEWSARVLKYATEDQIKVVWFVTGECDKVPMYLIHKTQRALWEEKTDTPIVNLGSAKQFEHIVGKKWGVKSPVTTKSGDQSFTAAVIETITVKRMIDIMGLSRVEAEEKFIDCMECEELPRDSDWFIKFLRKKKLEKIVGTFIDSILELAIEGKIHTDMLAFGTNSGRYSSRNPNCLSLDTEILTDKGWLTHETWDKNAKVASVNGLGAEWELPTKLYLSDDSPKDMVSIKNVHMDIRVTDNHRLPLYRRRGANRGSEVAFEAVTAYTRELEQFNLKHGAKMDGAGIPLFDNEIRFIAAIQADGHVYNNGYIRFSFTKIRKTERLISLLDALDIEYELATKDDIKALSGSRSDFYLRHSHYYVNELHQYLDNKEFNWGLLAMSAGQRQLFLEELDYWDGLSTRPRTNYNSCIEKNVDVVQALCALNGERAHKRVYDYNYSNNSGSLSYQLDMTPRDYSGFSNAIKSIETSNEKVWCVEVPSGKFIARRGSDTFVIYNCQQLPSHSALGRVIKTGFVA